MKTKLRKQPKTSTEVLIKVLSTIYHPHETLDSSKILKALKIAAEAQKFVDDFYADDSNYG